MFTNFLHMRLHKIVSLVVDNMFDTAKTHHENLLCNALIERFTLKPSRKIYNFLGFLFWIQAWWWLLLYLEVYLNDFSKFVCGSTTSTLASAVPTLVCYSKRCDVSFLYDFLRVFIRLVPFSSAHGLWKYTNKILRYMKISILEVWCLWSIIIQSNRMLEIISQEFSYLYCTTVVNDTNLNLSESNTINI